LTPAKTSQQRNTSKFIICAGRLQPRPKSPARKTALCKRQKQLWASTIEQIP